MCKPKTTTAIDIVGVRDLHLQGTFLRSDISRLHDNEGWSKFKEMKILDAPYSIILCDKHNQNCDKHNQNCDKHNQKREQCFGSFGVDVVIYSDVTSRIVIMRPFSWLPLRQDISREISSTWITNVVQTDKEKMANELYFVLPIHDLVAIIQTLAGAQRKWENTGIHCDDLPDAERLTISMDIHLHGFDDCACRLKLLNAAEIAAVETHTLDCVRKNLS